MRQGKMKNIGRNNWLSCNFLLLYGVNPKEICILLQVEIGI